MKMTELKKYQEAKIVSLNCPQFLKLRLLELGFTPDTTIVLLRKALFHGPIEISIRGSILALRQKEAENIEVKPCL